MLKVIFKWLLPHLAALAIVVAMQPSAWAGEPLGNRVDGPADASSKLHCLIVIDTDALGIGGIVHINRDKLCDAVLNPVQAHGRLGTVTVLAGAQVTPDDVLAALRAVAGLAPVAPPIAVRVAQGPLDDSGAVGDPLAADRIAANTTS